MTNTYSMTCPVCGEDLTIDLDPAEAEGDTIECPECKCEFDFEIGPAHNILTLIRYVEDDEDDDEDDEHDQYN